MIIILVFFGCSLLWLELFVDEEERSFFESDFGFDFWESFEIVEVRFAAADDEGITEWERFSSTFGGAGFFGIFFRLLMDTEEGGIVGAGWEDGSCLIVISTGDLIARFKVDSDLIEVFEGNLLIGFFDTFWALVVDLALDGDETISFFLVVIPDGTDDLISWVDWDLINFVDGRGFDDDKSKGLGELKNISRLPFRFTFNRLSHIDRWI